MNLLFQNNYLTIESNLVDLTDYKPKIPNNDLEMKRFYKMMKKENCFHNGGFIGKEFESSICAVLKTSQLELLSRLREKLGNYLTNCPRHHFSFDLPVFSNLE